MSFCCIDAWTVSVKVRFSRLGLLDGEGLVFCVVELSLVGVLDELSELSPADVPDKNGGRAVSCLSVDFDLGVSFSGTGKSEGRVAVGDAEGVSKGSGLSVLGMKVLSNTFAADKSAGPVRGPAG